MFGKPADESSAEARIWNVLQMAIAEPEGPIPIFDVRPRDKRFESLLPMIQEKLELPDYPASDLLRMILTELVRLIQELSVNQHGGVKAGFRLRAFRAQVISLRTLAGLVRQMEKLRKKEDLLKFDGPIVTQIISTFSDWVKQALKETIGGNDPATERSVLLHLRDIAAVQEPELRRKVDSLRR